MLKLFLCILLLLSLVCAFYGPRWLKDKKKDFIEKLRSNLSICLEIVKEGKPEAFDSLSLVRHFHPFDVIQDLRRSQGSLFEKIRFCLAHKCAFEWKDVLKDAPKDMPAAEVEKMVIETLLRADLLVFKTDSRRNLDLIQLERNAGETKVRILDRQERKLKDRIARQFDLYDNFLHGKTGFARYKLELDVAKKNLLRDNVVDLRPQNEAKEVA